jgi:DNA excision repair protein ERCC-4
MARLLPVILIDTREQPSTAWSFSPEVAFSERRTLASGDYSLDGLTDLVAVERKTLDDAVGSFFHDWLRFKKELRRLAAFESACVAVEANVADVIDHNYTSETHPNSVLGRAHSIYLDYGVPVFFWGARQLARHMAERYLLLAHKRYSSLSVSKEGE